MLKRKKEKIVLLQKKRDGNASDASTCNPVLGLKQKVGPERHKIL